MFKFLVPVLFFIITLFASGVSSVEAAETLNITSCNATVDLAYASANIVSGGCTIFGSTIVNPEEPLKNTLGDTSNFNLTPGTYTYNMNCGGTIDTATIVVSPPGGGCGGGAPATPNLTSVSTAASCGGNINLSYSSSGATRYHIYRSTNGTSGWTLVVTTTSTSYTDSGLAIGYTYYYKVQADTGPNTTLSDFSNVGSAVSSAACTTPVDGQCGPAAKNYASTETVYSGNLCSAGTASPASPSFPVQGGSSSWWCLGINGGNTSSQCTATRSASTYSCTGTTPLNASIYAGDDTGLIANIAKTYSSTNTLPKCQFACNSGYSWNGSACDSGSGVGKKLIVCPVVPADPVSVLVGQTVPLVSRYWASAGAVTCNTSGYTNVTNSSSWSVSNEHGTVSNSGTKGVVTGVSVGTVRVAATYDGLTANKDVEVTDGTGGPYTPPPDIDIVADPRIIRSGETTDVTVTVKANYPLTCQLYGAATGTFTHTTGTTEFDVASDVLTSARIVRAICTDPDGEVTQADARIEVIPTFQEI